MDVLMVVAPSEFRDEEFAEPRALLERAGHRVVVASRSAGPCRGTLGATVQATLALAEVHADRFDAAVFVGGRGAETYFDDPEAHRVAVAFARAGKVLGAICIAPAILARAGVLAGRRATVYPSERAVLQAHRALPQRQDVVIDGRIVTASGPAHAAAFGRALVQVLALHRTQPTTPPLAPPPSRP